MRLYLVHVSIEENEMLRNQKLNTGIFHSEWVFHLTYSHRSTVKKFNFFFFSYVSIDLKDT